MPTLLRLEKKTSLSGLRKHLPKQLRKNMKMLKKWHKLPSSNWTSPIIWAGYSHYLGWIFPLSGLDISAPCPPYRVLPVPPTDWVVKRDFKSFWAKLSPLQGAPCPPYRVLPVPPTGRSLSPLQIGWLRGILNHFEPRLFPYSCPDCSPTVALTVPLQGAIWLDIPIIWAGFCQNLGWFLSKSGLVFAPIWAGFCQNLGWFFSKSGLVFLKIWAGFSQNLGWFFSKSGLVFLKIWAG